MTLTGLIALAPTANAAVDAPGLELLTSDIDPAQPRADVLRVAVVSDFGACGYGIPAKCADQNAVADMIHSWNPDFIRPLRKRRGPQVVLDLRTWQVVRCRPSKGSLPRRSVAESA
ncbi:hypothetical protein [Polymorphospora sp. A560]|uniref:hypothetical protein n=1 Tax=Polymorphospora sp. A560 TaxID=3040203 RepID=UPI003891F4AB